MSSGITGIGQQPNGTDVFWGEITPCERVAQLYEEDAVFLDALEGYVTGGIGAGDGVIVLATPAHLTALENRLRARGVDIVAAELQDQYIAVEAEEALSKFMVNGWPEDDLFRGYIIGLVTRARKHGRGVRAFGELVALLWARGDNGATVRLEYLWHELCHTEAFSLFCAYPRIGFTQDASASIKEICDVHSRVVGRQDLLEPRDKNAT